MDARLLKVSPSKYLLGDWKIIETPSRWTASRIRPAKFLHAETLEALIEKIDAADDVTLTAFGCSFSEGLTSALLAKTISREK